MVATGDRGTERRQRHMVASPLDRTLNADEVTECSSSDCHLSMHSLFDCCSDTLETLQRGAIIVPHHGPRMCR